MKEIADFIGIGFIGYNDTVDIPNIEFQRMVYQFLGWCRSFFIRVFTPFVVGFLCKNPFDFCYRHCVAPLSFRVVVKVFVYPWRFVFLHEPGDSGFHYCLPVPVEVHECGLVGDIPYRIEPFLS